MYIRNKTSEAREIASGDFFAYVEPGETVEVPDEIGNGVKATGDEFLDEEKTQRNPEYHPGSSGLLAQSDVWERSSKAKAKDNDDTPAAGEEG